jgi:hypothetical protein
MHKPPLQLQNIRRNTSYILIDVGVRRGSPERENHYYNTQLEVGLSDLPGS